MSCVDYVGYVFQVPGTTFEPSRIEGLKSIYLAINYYKSIFELRGLCGCGAWHPYGDEEQLCLVVESGLLLSFFPFCFLFPFLSIKS